MSPFTQEGSCDPGMESAALFLTHLHVNGHTRSEFTMLKRSRIRLPVLHFGFFFFSEDSWEIESVPQARNMAQAVQGFSSI